MKYILQKPSVVSQEQTYPLWVVLHGAFDQASQAIGLFGTEAQAHHAFLLAPQASRPCGDGYCWSFARDAADIHIELCTILETEPIDAQRMALIGFSMGCTMGGWVLAQHPRMFHTFAALSMGSAFEPWEFDDGGIDLLTLQQTAAFTEILLAVDQEDPYGCNNYFAANLEQLRGLGFGVETCQPQNAVHHVTDEMKDFVLRKLAPGEHHDVGA